MFHHSISYIIFTLITQLPYAFQPWLHGYKIHPFHQLCDRKKPVLLPNDGAGRKALGQLGRCQLLTFAHEDASTSGTANNLQVVQTLSINKMVDPPTSDLGI